MGIYHLHITRREFWSYTESGLDITSEEWRAIVEGDSELNWKPERGPDVAVWIGPNSGEEDLLGLDFGNVWAKNPTPPLIEKMILIGRLLGARVQGLDGEIYDGREKEMSAAPTILERITDWFGRQINKK